MFDQDDFKISQIIDTGLDAILSGESTLEEFLARYPEQADALRAELELALWLVQRRGDVSARPGFLRASRNRVVARIKQEASQSGAKRSIFGFLLPQKVAYQLVAALLAIILFFSTTGGLVSAAQGALPGENLYAIKRMSEEIVYTLTFSEVGRVELSSSYTQRRLTEVLALMERGEEQESVSAAIQSFERQLNRTIVLLQSVSNIPADEKRDLAVAVFQEFTEQAARLQAMDLADDENVRNQVDMIEALMLLGANEAANEANNNSLEPTGTPIVIITLTPPAVNTDVPAGTPVPVNTVVSSNTPPPAIIASPTSMVEEQPVIEEKKPTKKPTNTPKPTNVNKPVKTEKTDNPNKPTSKPDNPNKPDKTQKTDNPNKPTDKPDNPNKPEKTDNPNKPEKTDNPNKPQKTDKPDNPNKPDKPEKTDNPNKPKK